MCGICGVISRNGDNIQPDRFIQMLNAIAHRGPDDEGLLFQNNLALGHRRLSILDLSSNGHQPMSICDKVTIIFNGEIYNYAEIRSQLEQRGYVFNTKSDTEVILYSYLEFGINCLNQFNGMWSFAIYDRIHNLLFCSRDRFGVKPFYYICNSNIFAFCSEISPLLKWQNSNQINQKILADYLFTGLHDHTTETFFNGIYKLKASNYLIYNLTDHSIIEKPYFSLEKHSDSLIDLTSFDKFETDFQKSIQLRLRSDVKIGTCLSGGLDSSSIAAIASNHHRQSSSDLFTAITIGSEKPDIDESYYESIVANKCHLNWFLIRPTFKTFYEIIDQVIITQEEPFGSPSVILQNLVFEKAKEIGCKVMLDGQGGDETLLGYERYFPAALISLFRHKGGMAFLNLIKQARLRNSKVTIYNLLKYFIISSTSRLRLFVNTIRMNFFKNNFLACSDFSMIKTIANSSYDPFEMQNIEIFATNLPKLLRYEDKNSMHYGIESRLPFLDYNFLQTAINLSIHQKIYRGWTKFPLRQLAAKHLPPEIAWRKNKIGFDAPEDLWLAKMSDEMLHEIISSPLIQSICVLPLLKDNFANLENRLKWRLFNVARWQRLFSIS